MSCNLAEGTYHLPSSVPVKNGVPLLSLLLGIFVFTTIAHGGVEVWSITIMHILSIVILGLWLIPIINKGHITLYRTRIDLLILLFLSFACTSLFFSVYPHASRIQLYKIINYTIIFYLLINILRERKRLLFLIWGIAIFGGIYAFSGLIFLGGKFLGFRIFSTAQYNLSFNFVNRNHFAGFLLMLTWLSIGSALAYKGSKRIFLFFCGIYSTLAIAFSSSRGGIIGFISGFFFFLGVLIINKEKKKRLALLMVFLLIIILILSLLGIEPVLRRMETLKNPLLAGKSRIEIWKGALSMIWDHPWSGTGIGTFIHAFPRYQSEYLSGRFVNHAHNDYLELGAEMGIVVILLFIAGIILFFRLSLKSLFSISDRHIKLIGFGALTSCFSFFIHSILDFNLFIPSNALFLIICAAIVAVITDHYAYGGKHPVFIDWVFTSKGKGIILCVFLILCILASIAVLSPCLGMIYFKKGKGFEKARNFQKAYTSLHMASLFDPGNAGFFAAMGDLMAKREKGISGEKGRERSLLEALRYYEDSIKASPNWGYYYTKKAFVLQRLGRIDEAEDAFEKAAYLHPVSAFPHYDLGTFYLKQGNLKKASREYSIFLKLDKRYAKIVFDEIWEVTQSYETIKKMLPKRAEIRKAFADYLFSKKENESAVNELALAFSLEQTPRNALLHLYGICKMKEYRKALEVGHGYLRKFGEDILLQKQVAKIHENLREFQKAIEIYQRLIHKDPSDVSLYIKLAGFYRKMNQLDECEEVLERGIEHNPYAGELYYYLGICYRHMKMTQKALESFKKAIFYKPEMVRYRYQLGVEYRRNRLYQEAVDEWKRCLKIDPNFLVCDKSIKDVYNKLQIYKKGDKPSGIQSND